MSTSPEPTQPAVVRFLYEVAKQERRDVLAELRRGLTDETGALGAMRYVAPFAQTERDLTRLTLFAGLFALYPEPGGMSLGQAMRVVRAKGSESIDGRVSTLLQAPSEDLATHLRHAVTLCRSVDARLDWVKVYWLLAAWDRDDAQQQKRFALDYWRTQAPAEAPAESST